ncbi:MAG: YdcF family protein [Planctomycetes bacterium]|nr:YdcF family protein [Planctomycetota bacterium]
MGPFRWAVRLAVVICLVGIAVSAFLCWSVTSFAEGRIYSVEDAPPMRVAVVFGARIYDNGKVSGHLARRLGAALELYQLGKVKKILVSGDNRFTHYNEPERMKEWLVDKGVPESDVKCDYAGRRTLDTCARASGLWNLDEAILVSQRYHLPRALYLAEHFNLKAAGVSCDGEGFYYGKRNQIREMLARVLAWLDVNVLDTEPEVWGKPESI